MRGIRGIVVCALALEAVKLLVFPFQRVLPTELLVLASTCLFTLLIAAAAWQASRKSSAYARMLWRCVTFVALLWTVNFSFGFRAFFLGQASATDVLHARWPLLVINSFPLAVALTLPLLLSEDREHLKVSWSQALDIAQLGLIVFAAFLVFFYMPSLHVVSDADRLRFISVMHLMRDGFLALGYLYRGWRSSFPDLRKLHLRLSGFLVAYGLSTILSNHGISAWHWSPALACFVIDLPPLGLLVLAATWRQGETRPRLEAMDRRERMIWTQALPLIMPVSVMVLASQITRQHLRAAWILVSASFVLYAVRLLLLQRQQNNTVNSLAAMEERFSKAFKSSPAAITISRLCDGKMIDANDRWLELMKLPRENAIGKTSIELGMFENSEEREEWVHMLRTNRSARGRTLNFKVAGRMLETLVSAEVIDLAGEPLIIASMLDVTEFRDVTHQLQQAQKMELVGSLAGGVAHDFNNLLTIITGYSALALSREPNPGVAEDIGRIREASGKAAGLTRQLLAFSRRQVLQPRNICLNTVVAHIENLLRRTIGENIALVESLDPQLGTVNADPVQMEQVVMNLAVNARDAMPQGGKLLFETRNLDLPTPYPQRGFEMPAGSYVLLVVTDTGTGIRREHMDRIFEPFFTTKGAGTGTGLGLSTVYGIVKQSGGYIWVYSDVGLGTTFTVCLPRVGLPPDKVQSDETERENLAGTGTVLVVDDDVRVCELTAKILSQYGYRVITADSGERAARRARDFEDEIHLLVTDVIMPGANGTELAQQLKAIRPALKILYMSGYPHHSRAGNGEADFRESTLLKPFTPIDLARATKRALNGG